MKGIWVVEGMTENWGIFQICAYPTQEEAQAKCDELNQRVLQDSDKFYPEFYEFGQEFD